MNLINYVNSDQTNRKVINNIKEGFKNNKTDNLLLSFSTPDDVIEALFEYVDEIPVNESQKDILSYIRDVKEGEKVDEGIFTGLLGAIGGLTFGPAIGKAICSALNIQKGVFYDLMTSRLVTTAICTKLGLRA